MPEPKDLRHYVEQHIRENPIKALGQAAALGYAMRFLPLRGLLFIGTQLVAPLLSMAGVWKAVVALDKRGTQPVKRKRR